MDEKILKILEEMRDNGKERFNYVKSVTEKQLRYQRFHRWMMVIALVAFVVFILTLRSLFH
jgi:hypothetical protein